MGHANGCGGRTGIHCWSSCLASLECSASYDEHHHRYAGGTRSESHTRPHRSLGSAWPLWSAGSIRSAGAIGSAWAYGVAGLNRLTGPIRIARSVWIVSCSGASPFRGRLGRGRPRWEVTTRAGLPSASCQGAAPLTSELRYRHRGESSNLHAQIRRAVSVGDSDFL